jgi:putative oxidoreductase
VQNSTWLTGADRAAEHWRDFLLLLGRILFGWIFVMSGFEKLLDLPRFAATMARRGLPEFMGYVAPFVEFISGVLLVVGFATRYASMIALLFIIVATLTSHRYWAAEPSQVTNQSVHFWKNVAMMGGAVLLFITGAGRYALDALARRTA